MAEQELKVKLLADIQSLEQGIKNGESALKAMEKTYSSLDKQLDASNKKTLEYEAALNSLQKEMSKAENQGKDYSDQLQKARDAVSDSRQVSEHYTNRLKDLSGEINKTADVVNRYKLSLDGARSSVEELGESQKVNQTNQLRSVSTLNSLRSSIQGVASGSASAGMSITRLATNMTVLSTSAGGTRAALAAITATLMGPAGVALAISGVIFAWQKYSASQKDAKTESEALKESIDKQQKALSDYISTLDHAGRASAGAASEYAKEIQKLDLLYSATQNQTLSREQQIDAARKLQDLYPQIFGGHTEDAILTNKAADAYFRLRDGIIAAAVAQSADRLASESMDTHVKNLHAAAKAEEDYNKIVQQRVDLEERFKGLSTSERMRQSAFYAETEKALEKSEKQALKTWQTFIEGAKEAAKEVQEFNKIAQENTFVTPERGGLIADLQKQIKKLQDEQPFITVKADLDINVAKINELNDELAKLQGKQTKADKARIKDINRDQKELEAGAKRLSDALIREDERTRIEAEKGREKELLASKIRFDNLVEQAKQFGGDMAEITRLRRADEDNINAKYDDIELKKQKELEDRKLKEQQKADDKKLKEAQRVAKAQEKIAEDLYKQQVYYLNILGDSVGNVFERMLMDGENIFKALGDEFKRLVVRMIADAAALEGAKLFGKLLGIGGLVGGGGGLLGFLTKGLGKMGGARAFADGGIVSGPTLGLIGEYAGARNNPEVVAPLNKLKDLMGNVGQDPIVMDVTIKGSDINLSQRRQDKFNNRFYNK